MPNSENKNKLSLEDKLFLVKRKEYKESHIKLDPELCKECSRHICTRICPAEVYVWNESENKVNIRYENCLECGTCAVACEMQNIEWSNPLGGAGIIYKDS